MNERDIEIIIDLIINRIDSICDTLNHGTASYYQRQQLLAERLSLYGLKKQLESLKQQSVQKT